MNKKLRPAPKSTKAHEADYVGPVYKTPKASTSDAERRRKENRRAT